MSWVPWFSLGQGYHDSGLVLESGIFQIILKTRFHKLFNLLTLCTLVWIVKEAFQRLMINIT